MSEQDGGREEEVGAWGPRSRWNVWVGALLLVGAAVLTGYLAAADAGTPDGPAARTDSARSVRAAREACGSLKRQKERDCYQEALSRRLREEGVGAAMTTLEGLYALDEDVQRDAHVYAHHIGIEAYQLTPSVAETFSGCSDMFSSGCYHGVIQAYFGARAAVDSASVNALCEPYKGDGQSRWILFQCLHGMGHGLTMHYDHHLVRALDACDVLAQNWDRQSCYGGVFMENVMAATTPHHPATTLASGGPSGNAEAGASGHGHAAGEGAEDGADEGAGLRRDPSGLYAPGASFKALDRDDPLYPCSIVDDRYQHSCYRMQTSVMLHLNGGDIGEAVESCAEAETVWRATCYESLGRDITAYALQDADEVIDECGRVEEGLHRGACYFGAVKALVDWRSAPEPGQAFCRKVEGDEYKTTCYEALGEEIATLVAGAEARAALCEKSEEAYVRTCRRGARLPAAASPATAGDGAL